METKVLKFIDIHCHYDDLSLNKLKSDFDSKKQISVTASVSFNSYKKLETIEKEKIPGLYFAYGLYPDVILNYPLEECLTQIDKIDFSKAIAVGEIGLDYKITKDLEKRKEELVVFEKQLEIAEKLNLPAIIHTRYATKKTLDVLTTTKHNKIILHWFDGNAEEIKTALDRGYYLTQRFAKPLIPDIKEHLDNIFIETDYPVPYAGGSVEIKDIEKSYEVFCNTYNLEKEFVKEKIQNNFLNLFPNINI